jgi:hypothetical protein
MWERDVAVSARQATIDKQQMRGQSHLVRIDNQVKLSMIEQLLTNRKHSSILRVTVLALTGFIAITALMFVIAGQAVAQDAGNITPTPAPSKTPGGVEATEVMVPLAEATDSARIEDAGILPAPFETLTQADLSILTGNVQRPNGIAWLDEQLYVSCTGDWTIYQIDPNNGQTLTYIYGIRNAHTLHAERGSDNEVHVWVPDFQTNALNDVTRNGVRTVAQGLAGPWGMTVETEETFLITNLAGNTLTRVGRNGSVDTLVGGLRAPTGVALDEDIAYVANNGSTRRAIEWFDLSTATPIEASEDGSGQSLVSGLQNVTGLQLADDGFLYFAFSLGTRGVVGRVDPVACRENGGCAHEDIEIVLLTELAAPLSGLTVSPDGRLFVHTMFSPDIYWAQLPGFEINEDAEA